MWPFPTSKNNRPAPPNNANIATNRSPIGYVKGPQPDQGATLFAPFNIPGKIQYTIAGQIGLDFKAPVQHQFWFLSPASENYRHEVASLINPAQGDWTQGTWESDGLMPLDGQGGGSPDAYEFYAEAPDYVP